MIEPLSYRQHARAVLVLGLPLIGSHLAQFAITMIDMLMLGWYSVETLAAVTLGGSLYYVVFLVGSGFAWAVMPMVASAAGSGETTQVRRVTRMGLWLSLIFGTLSMPFFWYSGPILEALGQDETISAMAQDYLRIAGPAILPALVVMVLKSYLSALERAQVVLWVTLTAVVVNIVFNYALIFGNWGFPELGIRGAAIASIAVQIVSTVLLAIYTAWVTSEHALFQRFWRPDWEAFGTVFRLGWPIGLTSLAEVGLFTASSLMMGWLGTIPLAAHGIALQITSATFMVQVGFANVATIRAGRAHGSQDAAGLRRGAAVVLALSGIMALLTILLFLTVPEILIGAFISPSDPVRGQVIAIGSILLAAAALFQLVDAAQVLGLGLLRGLQDTRVPMVVAVIAYWGIGVPVSYVLGFHTSLGAVGIWLGLALGLAVAAVFFVRRFWRRMAPV